jgi:thioredoxin-like negative regulator of GroEL
VLPGYFKGSIYVTKAPNLFINLLLWMIAVIFFIAAIANLLHPLLALTFGVIGFILLPRGRDFIERKLRFRLTPLIKWTAVAVLFLISLPLINHYAVMDTKAALALQIKLDHEAAEKAAIVKAAREKKDSLLFYLRSATELGQIDKATGFASSDSDRALIGKARTHLRALQLFTQVKQGKYAAVLPAISALIVADPTSAELLYQRAICYSKTGHTAEAVTDLSKLVATGDADAIKLHDKINPLTRHVAYYTTKCRDGSTTSSKGRGACSYHGGVANWNAPVYETSRKYQ